MPDWYRWDGEDLILDLHIQPRASRDGIAGEHGSRLKVRLTAPPVDGKANRHLLKFLAGLFGVANRDVSLLSGDTGREKRVRIHRPQQLPPAITRD